MSLWQIIIYLIIALYFVTMLAVVANVILENRNPVRTLAWSIFIMSVPLLGIIFYIYLGVNYRRVKMFSRKELGDIKWLQYMSEDQKQKVQKSNELKSNTKDSERKLMTLLLNNSKALLSRKNHIKILNNGEATFEAIYQAVAKAKNHIHLEYYIVECGRIYDRLEEILLEKLKEGVEVRFIYDDVGSWSFSKYAIKRLVDSGAQVFPFLPVRFNGTWRTANYRNHRKIIVIDGEVGFVGGINFADRYVDGIPGVGEWRDTHLRVEGEAVTSLQTVFLIDWYFVRQELLLDKLSYLPNYAVDNDVTVQLVSSGPDSDWASIQQAYFSMIMMAKERVFISTPYFMPGETTLNALKTAAMSGVDVRLMLPSNSDSWLTQWCTRSFVMELLEAKVKIYWYKPGLNHSKILIADRDIASVGTANMDIRSMEQNFEVNLIIYDENVVQELTKYYFDDLKVSKQQELSEWKFRPRNQRVKESFARLFAPVL